MTDRCQSCPADVRWARTVQDRPILLDLEPVDDGNVVLFLSGAPRMLLTDALNHAAAPLALGAGQARAVVIRDRDRADGIPGNVARYVAHFATCPAAAEHRRRQAKAAHPAQGRLL